MKRSPLFIFALLSLMLFGCKTQKMSMASQKDGPVVEMYRGACFGHCPVYLLSYYSDGTILYEGHRFTERNGIYLRQATESEKTAITQNLANLQWQNYEEYYESQIPDLPVTSLSHKGRTTKFKENAPLELNVMGSLLKKIADEGDWQKLVSYQNDDQFKSRQLTVKLADVTAQKVIDDLQIEELQAKKQVSAHMNTWLIGFDPQKISPGQVYLALQSHPKVEMVEFEVQLQLREE